MIVALATTGAILSGSTVKAEPVAELPREILRGVELTLPDGEWRALRSRV